MLQSRGALNINKCLMWSLEGGNTESVFQIKFYLFHTGIAETLTKILRSSVSLQKVNSKINGRVSAFR